MDVHVLLLRLLAGHAQPADFAHEVLDQEMAGLYVPRQVVLGAKLLAAGLVGASKEFLVHIH